MLSGAQRSVATESLANSQLPSKCGVALGVSPTPVRAALTLLPPVRP
jgi:hypothetical protein